MRHLKFLAVIGAFAISASFALAQNGPGYGNQGNGNQANPGNSNQGYGNPGDDNQGYVNQGYDDPAYGNQGYGPPVYNQQVYVGPPPVCAYGYYNYYPYTCAPYGYYGPSWFSGGIFIGAGPWFRDGFYGGRGFYG